MPVKTRVILRRPPLLSKFVLTAVAALFCAASAFAAGGQLDPGFNPGAGASDAPFDVAVQADGKVIVVGTFTSFDNRPRKYIARLNSDGSLDTSFNPSADSTVYSVALARDGKILIGGSFTTVGGVPRGGLARLNEDGSVDTTFNPGALNAIPFGLAEQQDGKLLVVGAFTQIGNTSRNRVARLNPDGSLDTGFDPGSGASNQVAALALQPDGKVLVGGFFNSFNGTPRARLARLNSDGSLDTGFDPGAGPQAQNQVVFSIALQPDGRIIVGGDFAGFNVAVRNGVVRLFGNGSVDFSFDPGSGADTYAVRRVAYQAGKVIVGGNFLTFNGVARKFVARLNGSGSLDTTFDTGSGLNGGLLALAVQPDDSVVVGGTFTAYGATQINRVARLQPAPGMISFAATDVRVNEGAASITVTRPGGSDGAVLAKLSLAHLTTSPADVVAPGGPEPGFNPGSDGLIYDAAVQPDDKVIIVGSFLTIGGAPRSGIARLNANGSVDPTFANQLHGAPVVVAVQKDGKVLVAGGDFSFPGAVVRHGVARLNPDGSLDTGFDPGTGPDIDVSAVAPQPGGKVLVAGRFTTFNGVARKYIARLNADGSVDATFDPGSTATTDVDALAITPDGKILAGGQRLIGPAFMYTGLVRLNGDGSLDKTFTVTGADGVRAVRLLGNGKILIGGFFTSVGGAQRNCIARLNSDGSLDTTFNPGAGAGVAPGGSNNSVASIDVQWDGKVVVAGTFTLFDGLPRMSIARLNEDGSLDTSFDPGAGPRMLGGPGVNVARLQSSGSIVIAGGFTTVDGVPRNRVAALVGDLLASWADGDGSDKVIPLPVVDDLLDEPDEALTLTLSIISGPATLGPNQAVTVTVADVDVPPQITSAPPPPVTDRDVFFSHTFKATGYPTPTFAVTKDSILPPGLFLSTSGTLSGTPSVSGIYNITVTASNGVAPSGSQTFTLKVNAPPVALADFYSVNEDTQLSVAAPGVLANDTDADGDAMTVALFNSTSRGVVTLNADGSFTYVPAANFNGTDSFKYRVTDGQSTGSIGTVSITVNAVNDPPVNIVPTATQKVGVGPLVFSAANGNRIAVSDIDAGGSPVRVSLTGTNGTLTLKTTAGLTFSAGDGTDDATMTFTGTTTAINSALDGLSFRPTQNYRGPGSLQIVTNDLGNTGSGGPLTDSDTVNITILPGGLLQFGAPTYQTDEGGGRASITITRTDDTTGEVSVTFKTLDDPAPVPCDPTAKQPDGTDYPHGTAYARCDYATTVSTVTFAAGDSAPKTVTIPLIDDVYVEGPETVQLRLLNPVGAALGSQSTATLTITDNDFVPGATNPILLTQFFVRQQYLDFLSREPEPGEPWSATINNCAAGDPSCDRISVSANFFRSTEFQLKGLFVFKFYKVSFGRMPTYSEIVSDMSSVTGSSTAELIAKKAAFTSAWAQRQEFTSAYGSATNQQFVDALMGRYNLQSITTLNPASPDDTQAPRVTLAKADLVNQLTAGALTRGQVVRAVADSTEVGQVEFNPAFVAMQYFGYLRRDPEPAGYQAWLQTINANPSDFRSMVNGFMNSTEYRLRFGQP